MQAEDMGKKIQPNSEHEYPVKLANISTLFTSLIWKMAYQDTLYLRISPFKIAN